MNNIAPHTSITTAIRVNVKCLIQYLKTKLERSKLWATVDRTTNYAALLMKLQASSEKFQCTFGTQSKMCKFPTRKPGQRGKEPLKYEFTTTCPAQLIKKLNMGFNIIILTFADAGITMVNFSNK